MASSTLSTNEKQRGKIIDALEALGSVTKDFDSVANGIRDHKETFYVKPETRSYGQMAEIAISAANEEKQTVNFSRTFNYRPWDGAHAVAKTLMKIYGYPGFGKATMTMFGKMAPRRITINVSPSETVEVPWGDLSVPDLEAVLSMGATLTEDYGMVFQLSAEAPKKMEGALQGFFVMVEEELRTGSIYKGKAITSTTDPKFLDPYKATNRDHIVFSKATETELRGAVWEVIRHTERARARGMDIRRSVLFYGEPGNAKSETINITAQEAMENGWTYVFCAGSSAESFREALQTARLLSPSVLAVEDIDRLVADIGRQEMSKLLEELDGTTSKGYEIITLFTTNFIDDLYQPVRRRMYKQIHFAGLDRQGMSRLMQLRLEGEATDDFDFDAVAAVMDGWSNSYLAKVIDQARSLALDDPDQKISTQDMLDSAEAYRAEWESYQRAKARPEPNKLDAVLTDVIGQILQGHIVNYAGEHLAIEPVPAS